ncbi:MAG: MSMEG_6728 family protein [Mycobacteriales bacterium]
MQTFLPYADFEASANALDLKRLGKQRVEVIQIVRALTWPKYGWAHHPAVLMWKGYEEALGTYGLTCCRVWVGRGHDDTCAGTIATDLRAIGIEKFRTQPELAEAGALPGWLGDEAFHLGHQSSLLRKDPGWYEPQFPGLSSDLPYVWPVRSEQVILREQRAAARAAAKSARTRGE